MAAKKPEAFEIYEMVCEARDAKNIFNNPKLSIKLCDDVLKMDQYNLDAMLIKAGALKELFNIKEFDAFVKTIIEKYPKHWEAYYLLAQRHFAQNQDVLAMENINKSLDCSKTFDNIIMKAQMMYLTGDNNYTEYVEMAKKLDKKRTENFMKNYWIYDMNNVKPTLSETLSVIKQIIKGKIKL